MKQVTRGNITIELIQAPHGEFDDFYRVSKKGLSTTLVFNTEQFFDLEKAIHRNYFKWKS